MSRVAAALLAALTLLTPQRHAFAQASAPGAPGRAVAEKTASARPDPASPAPDSQAAEREVIVAETRRIVAQYMALQHDQVRLESRLAEDLEATQFDRFDIMLRLEGRFSVAIPDEVQPTLQTVADVVAWIESHPHTIEPPRPLRRVMVADQSDPFDGGREGDGFDSAPDQD